MLKILRYFLIIFGWRNDRGNNEAMVLQEPSPVAPVEELTPEPETAAEPSAQKPARQPSMQHGLRTALLDQLDVYFRVLRRMRKYDRETYDRCSQTGMNLLQTSESDNRVYVESLDPWWLKNRPGFGAVVWHDPRFANDGHDPKMVYFSKFVPRLAPVNLQPAHKGTDVYVCTMYWDTLDPKKAWLNGFDLTFGVEIDANGGVRLLKIRQQPKSQRSVAGQTVRGMGPQVWRFPQWYKDMCKRNDGEDVHTYFKAVFIQSCNAWVQSQNATAFVRVMKDNLTGVFAIDPRSTAKFFSDREIDGTGQKIFHSVRPHERIGTKNGVRMHFRGKRKFIWNGYDIHITIPGRDHIHLGEFEIPGIDSSHAKAKKLRAEVISQKEVGEMLADAVWGDKAQPSFMRKLLSAAEIDKVLSEVEQKRAL